MEHELIINWENCTKQAQPVSHEGTGFMYKDLKEKN